MTSINKMFIALLMIGSLLVYFFLFYGTGIYLVACKVIGLFTLIGVVFNGLVFIKRIWNIDTKYLLANIFIITLILSVLLTNSKVLPVRNMIFENDICFFCFIFGFIIFIIIALLKSLDIPSIFLTPGLYLLINFNIDNKIPLELEDIYKQKFMTLKIAHIVWLCFLLLIMWVGKTKIINLYNYNELFLVSWLIPFIFIGWFLYKYYLNILNMEIKNGNVDIVKDSCIKKIIWDLGNSAISFEVLFFVILAFYSYAIFHIIFINKLIHLAFFDGYKKSDFYFPWYFLIFLIVIVVQIVIGLLFQWLYVLYKKTKNSNPINSASVVRTIISIGLGLFLNAGCQIFIYIVLYKFNILEINHKIILCLCGLSWIMALTSIGVYVFPHSFSKKEEPFVNKFTDFLKSSKSGKIHRLLAFVFLRNLAIKYPIAFPLGLFLHLIISIWFVFLLLGETYLSICRINITSTELNIDTINVWMGSLVLFMGPMALMAGHRDEHIRQYSQYEIHKVLENLQNHDVILGYGNRGRIVADKLKTAAVLTPNNRDMLWTDLRLFLISLDPTIRIVILYNKIVIVDKSERMFMELFVENNGGGQYGYVYSPLASEDKKPLIINDDSEIEMVFALPGVKGEASSRYVFQLVNYSGAISVIDATSDRELPLRIKQLFKNQKVNTVISVQDSASYSQIIGDSRKTSFFMVYPSIYEGDVYSQKISFLKEKLDLPHPKILVIGSGKSIYYFLKAVYKSIYRYKSIDMCKNIRVITNDSEIANNLNTFFDSEFWNFYPFNVSQGILDDKGYLVDKINIQIKKYQELNTEILKEEISKHLPDIVLYFTDKSYESIKFINHYFATLDFMSIKDKLPLPSLLLSCPKQDITDIRKRAIAEILLNDRVPENKYKGFPDQIYDLIFTNDEIAGLQSASMADSFKKQKKDIIPSEIVFCSKDDPGSLFCISAVLSGFSINMDQLGEYFLKVKSVPSFNHYHIDGGIPIKQKDINQIFNGFIFKASVTLKKPSSNKIDLKEIIHSSWINMASENDKEQELIEYLSDIELIKKDKNFKLMCPRQNIICPISIGYQSSHIDNNIHINYVNTKYEVMSDEEDEETFELHVLCDNYETPGIIAIMLRYLMLIDKDVMKKAENTNSLFNISYLSNLDCLVSNLTLKRFIGTYNVSQHNGMNVSYNPIKAFCIKYPKENIQMNLYINELYEKIGGVNSYDKYKYSNGILLYCKNLDCPPIQSSDSPDIERIFNLNPSGKI